MSELLSPTFNLVVLVGILVYYMRQPVREFITNRHNSVRLELERVSALLKQATDQNAEFTAKLKAIDAELSSIREQMAQDAVAAKHRIAAEAQKLSLTIAADSRTAAESLYSDLKSQLFRELGSRVIERAEAILRERLTGDDRARIRQEFSSQVESVQ